MWIRIRCVTVMSALLAAIASLFIACSATANAASSPLSAQTIGLTLAALDSEDLDAIQTATGRRVGVMVTEVEEDSPAAKAGIRAGDILLAFGSKGIDSPAAADEALTGKTGKLDTGILRITGDEPQAIIAVIVLPGAIEKDADKENGKAAAGNGKRTTTEATIRARIKALEDAREAGVLSGEEYTRKKTELEAQLKAVTEAPDPALQKKLKALDDARKAGVLSDAEYAAKRAELLDAKPADDRSAPSAARGPLIPAVKSKVFHHPIGFEFVHPADWSVAEQGDALLLTPPNAAKDAQGAQEVYLITGERVDTEGITRPDDPRVAEFLNGQVKGLAPFLQRAGTAGSCDTASGKGVVLDWAGKNPQGQALLARCYVNVIKGHGVALAGIGIRTRIEARDATLRRIFASFGMSEGKIDPTLVGGWTLASTSSLTNWSAYEDSWSRARSVSESSTRLILGGDGTWSRVYESQTIAGAGGIWLESSDRKTSKGRWYAGGGMLYLVTDNDLWETYKYAVEGAVPSRRLRLASEKTGTLWQESR